MYLYFCGFIITSIFINFVKSFVERWIKRSPPKSSEFWSWWWARAVWLVARRQSNGRHGTGSRQRGWAPTQWLKLETQQTILKATHLSKRVQLGLGDNREFMNRDDWIKAGTVRYDGSWWPGKTSSWIPALASYCCVTGCVFCLSGLLLPNLYIWFTLINFPRTWGKQMRYCWKASPVKYWHVVSFNMY